MTGEERTEAHITQLEAQLCEAEDQIRLLKLDNEILRVQLAAAREKLSEYRWGEHPDTMCR